MKALVLSGGGAKGAYQYGALMALRELGNEFDVISGVSVGSLNGSMLAMDKFAELGILWETIRKSDIYEDKTTIGAIINAIFGRSLYENWPLHKLLYDLVKLEDFKKPFHFGMVELRNGQYVKLSNMDFAKDTHLADAIFASSTMPIYWDTIKSVKTKDGIYFDCVDGGLRDNSPLGDILDYNPEEIFIINCNRSKLDEYRSKKTMDIAVRSILEIMLNEVLLTDFDKFFHINDLVDQVQQPGLLKKPDGSPYKWFKAHMFEPSRNIGSVLDFSRSVLDDRIKLGYDDVMAYYNN